MKLATSMVPSLLFAGYEHARPQTQNKAEGFDLVDKDENIRRPSDFRDRY
jgi:hypothetical protein